MNFPHNFLDLRVDRSATRSALTNNNLASQTQVDCSKAGLKKMPTTKSELAMAKTSTPPGCHMVPGQGIFEYVYLSHHLCCI